MRTSSCLQIEMSVALASCSLAAIWCQASRHEPSRIRLSLTSASPARPASARRAAVYNRHACKAVDSLQTRYSGVEWRRRLSTKIYFKSLQPTHCTYGVECRYSIQNESAIDCGGVRRRLEIKISRQPSRHSRQGADPCRRRPSNFHQGARALSDSPPLGRPPQRRKDPHALPHRPRRHGLPAHQHRQRRAQSR